MHLTAVGSNYNVFWNTLLFRSIREQTCLAFCGSTVGSLSNFEPFVATGRARAAISRHLRLRAGLEQPIRALLISSAPTKPNGLERLISRAPAWPRRAPAANPDPSQKRIFESLAQKGCYEKGCTQIKGYGIRTITGVRKQQLWHRATTRMWVWATAGVSTRVIQLKTLLACCCVLALGGVMLWHGMACCFASSLFVNLGFRSWHSFGLFGRKWILFP